MSGIYVIYQDSMDDCCDIAGYILGTEAEAEELCEKTGYDWVRLDRLDVSDAEKVIKIDYGIFGRYGKVGFVHIATGVLNDIASAQEEIERHKSECDRRNVQYVPLEYKIMKRTWTRFRVSGWRELE